MLHIIALITIFSYYYDIHKKLPFLKKEKEATVILQKQKPKPKPRPKPKPKPKPKAQPLPAFSGMQKPQIKKKKHIEKPKPQKPKPKPKIEKPEPKKEQPETKLMIQKKKKPEKKLTLADISKGFLDYSKKQGNNLVRYTKSRQGMPTEEQLKHERYVSKILSCIKTSLSIRKNMLTFVSSVSTNDILIVDINVLLDKNGSIANLQIANRSGVPEFDAFMLTTLHESGSSFPPVPSYFNVQQYFIPIRFHIPVAMFIQPHTPTFY